ncbi:IS66 family insertion sequence element accessory protein TnpB [Streptococcus suis]|uniref:IS66 family insertion sequence element accessory protein TnpB n=1 Tax=Streptococcus suis TaxID=1307 RepID=A0A9X4N1Q4_STRSU|nr:IS66 family insertion sequence element accessory protein TnpB [Streptococcus suis]MDG4528173.1 IS66 family insertion sequence element accessory protein TnpB [Streptococcus suis]MDG4530544.1 IS66 family insertion sequence element accessory protein TnpB [Streptococcus suis]
MTIRLSDLGQVFLVCGKTDMRQGIDSLAYLVKSQFNLDPFSGQVYLFCGGLSLLRRSKRPIQSSLLGWTRILVIV